ncbi:MAG: coproporphyrinogen-III oxidase family protein, partial [Candidatus Sumerlaeota bacterium]
SNCEEITIECNPVSSDMERLQGFVEAGINRVSLGVQSFDDTVLKNLGRSHSSEEAVQACLRLSELGLRSWSLDLIFGAPYAESTGEEASRNDRQRFIADLDHAIALEPQHMSVYGLTVHEGTPLMDMVAQGRCRLPAEETQREQFLMARRALGDAGYRHYEISNYARAGHESRHNSLYWTGGEYLGVGPGAHSFFGGVRRANPADIEKWRVGLEAGEWPAQAEEAPDIPSLRGERIMLALRRLEGVSVEQLDRMIGGDFATIYSDALADLKRRGLVRWDGVNLRLSEEGLLLSDTVFETFF